MAGGAEVPGADLGARVRRAGAAGRGRAADDAAPSRASRGPPGAAILAHALLVHSEVWRKVVYTTDSMEKGSMGSYRDKNESSE